MANEGNLFPHSNMSNDGHQIIFNEIGDKGRLNGGDKDEVTKISNTMAVANYGNHHLFTVRKQRALKMYPACRYRLHAVRHLVA